MRPPFLNFIRRRGITSSDSDVRAYIAALQAAGGSISQARADLYTTYVTSGKANGWWAKLDQLCVYAGEDAASGAIQSTMDLKLLLAHTLVNSPTGTNSVGFQGNGTSSYVRMPHALSAGPNASQNDSSIGVFVQTVDSRSAADYVLIGAQNGAAVGNTLISKASGTTAMKYAVNNNGAAKSATTAQSVGLWHAERTGAGALELYLNGVSKDTDTTASTSIETFVPAVLAYNNAGAFSNYSNAVASLSFTGASMGDTIAAAFSADTQTLLHAINASAFP